MTDLKDETLARVRAAKTKDALVAAERSVLEAAITAVMFDGQMTDTLCEAVHRLRDARANAILSLKAKVSDGK